VKGFQSPPQNPRSIAGGFVKVQAFAKINLHLNVLDKLKNGYHNIVSIKQSVGLCDDLIFTAGENGRRKIELNCDDPNLPTDESNLIVKAAKLLMHEYDVNHPVCIKLIKRIPVGAGLAGGSTDCAATLRGINELFKLGISTKRLMEYGTGLGADVPFCLTGGTALAEGIGDKLTALPAHPDCYIVIVCPMLHVSTAESYSQLDNVRHNEKTNHIKLEKLAGTNNIDFLVKAISTKNINEIANSFFNVFTPVTGGIYPEIFEIINDLKSAGALGASMSGTGSAVFAYFNGEVNANFAKNKFSHKYKVFVTKPLPGFNPV